MMDDRSIPKFMINREHYYPIDSILFGKDDIYIKVVFIRDLFNDYINKSFNIVANNINDPFKFACVGAQFLHYTTVEGKSYHFHKCDVSGNEDNYIQIYRKMLLNCGKPMYISQSMDPYNRTFYFPDIDIHALKKEEDENTVLVYSTVEDKRKNITIVNHTSSKKEDHLHVVVNSCHPIFGGKFLATFSVLTKHGSKFDFETKVKSGYQF